LKGANYNVLSNLHVFDSRANLNDHPGRFMADHLRDLDSPIHVAVVDMHIRPTDATVSDLQPHFARIGWNDSALADSKCSVAFVICGFHHKLLLRTGAFENHGRETVPQQGLNCEKSIDRRRSSGSRRPISDDALALPIGNVRDIAR
jgi:hypothetical protein